ncbi:NUDIX domain-containing protein [Sporosarcina thermotolerans]|uniref:NUDIX domain-containing protein n=1 Tax=Sporosarcina thermotolerans TaxID=633404 RepID=A0AAW9A7U8_9BACL|nr:NUDIX domain-containing protein [Sporosarcina thermotolerans]MDW0117099.1 NUDIX domain-containing protein [Sporosarcina thermotolerans]WHT47809.1 NUDIX domain-containing protein [Sporosarcina thermotolerans]
MKQYPRAKVIGVLQSGSRILVEEFTGKHSKGVGAYYRPIGGSIEFGERSTDALLREFEEELQVTVEIKGYMGCMENIFAINEQIGHEIIQVYRVGFIEEKNYSKEKFEVLEGKHMSFANWVKIADFIVGDKILYPDSLINKLKGEKL